MWISKVDDVMTSEKKDSVQINNPLMMNNDDFNHLRSPMTSKRSPIVQKVVNLSELTRETSAVVSLSQKRISNVASYASALSGVDESLFMAD
ncbi:MAG: hypothetical protein IJ563_13255 [Selenomonadaceae bacterium]|nr:hypothetical protein [Selenomonadaceae bacterium]